MSFFMSFFNTQNPNDFVNQFVDSLEPFSVLGEPMESTLSYGLSDKRKARTEKYSFMKFDDQGFPDKAATEQAFWEAFELGFVDVDDLAFGDALVEDYVLLNVADPSFYTDPADGTPFIDFDDVEFPF